MSESIEDGLPGCGHQRLMPVLDRVTDCHDLHGYRVQLLQLGGHCHDLILQRS